MMSAERNAYMREYRQRRKASGRPLQDSSTREQNLHQRWWTRFRKRPAEVRAIWESQGGVCAICTLAIPAPGQSKNTHVDHDHATGAVRGVLCNHCNLMLGHAKDDPVRLRAAALYLKP